MSDGSASAECVINGGDCGQAASKKRSRDSPDGNAGREEARDEDDNVNATSSDSVPAVFIGQRACNRNLQIQLLLADLTLHFLTSQVLRLRQPNTIPSSDKPLLPDDYLTLHRQLITAVAMRAFSATQGDVASGNRPANIALYAHAACYNELLNILSQIDTSSADWSRQYSPLLLDAQCAGALPDNLVAACGRAAGKRAVSHQDFCFPTTFLIDCMGDSNIITPRELSERCADYTEFTLSTGHLGKRYLSSGEHALLFGAARYFEENANAVANCIRIASFLRQLSGRY